MKRSNPLLYLALGLIGLLPLTAGAQTKIENCLLWRISGNGLSQPSYLYGTIHLTDKQVFEFGDSLYAALEKSAGYAMELSPDSIMNKVFKEVNEDKALLKKAVSAADFNRMRKKLQTQFKKDPNLITVKEFRNYFIAAANKVTANSMHTFMDAWFYDAMRRQGKWVGGVEDMGDQDDMEEIAPISNYVEDFLDDNRKSREMLARMITIYKNQDLQSVAELEEGKLFFSDSIMLRRNKKMARRMDSLARIRNTFFAVGAGHLPGDSGVIMHLRSRGFTVEAVRSSRTIHAANYHFEEKELPWATVVATSGHYTVQMPGEPQNMGAADENMEMKMYGDIGSNLFYFVAAISGRDNANIDSIVAASIRNMTKTARVRTITPISKDSVEGREVIAGGNEGVFRMQCYYRSPVVYMVMIASPVDSLTHTPDAERFLRSLVMIRKPQSDYVPWSEYRNERHAFSIRFPAKPTEKKEPDNEGTTQGVNFSSLDVASDMYFQLRVEEMKKGYFLQSDTASFYNYKQFLAGSKDCKVLSHTYATIDGYPVMWTTFIRKSAYGNYYNKVMSLHRGNRFYYAAVTVADSAKFRGLIDRFFQSFTMLPVASGNWTTRHAPDQSFSVWSATPVTLYTDSSDQDPATVIYELYDPADPCTYYLRKEAYNPYFWADSDTALLRRTVKNILSYNDKLLSYELVTNGPYKGVEILVGLPDNHNLKKMRLLLVGDSVFTLYGINAPAMLEAANSRRVFTDLTVAHHTPSTLFTNKAASLLQALQSTDSATFATAKQALRLVTFEKPELPLLQQAVLRSYRDSAEYTGASSLLLTALAELKDESTLAFVQETWKTLPAEKERLRYDLLDVLARIGTQSSLALARDLVMQRQPTAGDPSSFFSSLSDSLALVAPLLPSLLPLLHDSLAAPNLVSLVEEAVDSNLVDLSILTSWKPALYKLAATRLQETKKTGGMNWFIDRSVIDLLSKLKDPAAFQWVRQFLAQPNGNMKYAAARALLKTNQPVPATELLKLAADPAQRNDLYILLKDLSKTALFPAQYRTQKALAEAELYGLATDEGYDHAQFSFLGERTATSNGVRRKYYLFKVTIDSDEEKTSYLGMTGPYGLQPGKLLTESRQSGIYWSKGYNAATLEADFKAFLKQWEGLAY